MARLKLNSAFGLPKHHDDNVVLVISQIPEFEEEIKLLLRNDWEFRDMYSDYIDCIEILNDLEKSAVAGKARVKQYKKAKQELFEEIKSYLIRYTHKNLE